MLENAEAIGLGGRNHRLVNIKKTR